MEDRGMCGGEAGVRTVRMHSCLFCIYTFKGVFL